MKNLSKKTLREFGFLISFGFPIIIGWLIPFIFSHSFREWTFWVGIISLIATLIKPYSLYYPYKIWMKLGYILGWINSRIILGLVFILVLIPIAFIMKLTGYDPLRKKSNNNKTYRENNSNHKINLNKIF